MPALQQRFSVQVFETQFSSHAIQLSEEAVAMGFEIILSAGGDGTLNQVVNGMLKTSSSQLPSLGIIPLGSGNDFAAMMGVSGRPDQLINLLKANKPLPVDVGKIHCFNQEGAPIERHFINVCSLGMGPATVTRLERLPRWLCAGLRYYVSVINTFLTHTKEEFEVLTSQWKWSGKARVVAIANGISFGNKIYIAPEAKPDDGIFSTFIATDMALLKFLYVLQMAKGRKKVMDKSIHYSEATELTISSPNPAMIETEGELVGWLPARIDVLKGRIQFLK